MQLRDGRIVRSPEPAAGPQERRRALLISAVVPDSNGIGIQRRAYQHLWCLSRLYRIDLVVQPRREAEIPAHVLDACEACLVLPVVRNKYFSITPLSVPGMTLLRECLLATRRSWYPYGRRTRRAIASRLRAELPGRYSAAFLFRIDTAWLDPCVQSLLAPGALRILDLDDSDSAFLRGLATVQRRQLGLELAAAYRVRAALMASTERLLRRSFDIVTLSCAEEAVGTRKEGRVPGAAEVLANYIPVYEQPLPPADNAPKRVTNLLFVGFLGYIANADGIMDFCRNVLPILERDSPTRIALTIVGRDPPPALQALSAPPRITLAGWVEDLEPYYAMADIAIIPLRIGSGTRLKALEAMSMGRPLVSTTLGVSGLGLLPDRHFLLGDTPAAFANACLQLIKNPATRVKITHEARAHVRQTFSLDAALSRLHSLLTERGEIPARRKNVGHRLRD